MADILIKILRYFVSACIAYYYTTLIYLVLRMIVNVDKEKFSMSDSSTVQWFYFSLVTVVMLMIYDSELVLETLLTIAVGTLHLSVYLSAKYPNAGIKSFKYMFRDLRRERQERIDRHKSKPNKQQ